MQGLQPRVHMGNRVRSDWSTAGLSHTPVNARTLDFSRDRQELLKLWEADFFWKGPRSIYFRLCGPRGKIKDIMYPCYITTNKKYMYIHIYKVMHII